SYYFGKDAYENMIKDSKYTSNKELLTIPGAVHTDLYDNLEVIPFDKIQKFFGSIIFFVGLTLPRYRFSKPSASLDMNLR
ncbi:MAG: hypothetical protein MR816_10055, partial [Blautia sp.]|nr:hypothetical protein [Blautia sp.]